MMESLEHTSIVTKGRRTKRQRSAITSASSTGGCGGGGGFEINNYSSSTASASASGNNSDDQDIMSEITTEEEDMANCLIMLARGTTTTSSTAATTVERLPIPNNKFECKTCNKIFHSFQALGGHRASHKRPKPTLPESPIPSPSPSLSPSLSPDHNQQTKVNNINNKVVAVRVHECSICGSEFPSGQALGGHMRRHRAPPSSSAAGSRSIKSSVPLQIRNVLPLDLNLPAPGDDDDHKIEQERLDEHMQTTSFHRVLPTPALVDCHY